MISVRGIGWLTETAYGAVRRQFRQDFRSGDGVGSLAKVGIVPTPYRNFGRLDPLSRVTIAAVALAFSEVEPDVTDEPQSTTGIIGTTCHGSLAADLSYFKDYVENGRTLGRANLFIYTLPTSPLGETAIQFGLTGPLLYAADRAHSLGLPLDLAEEMIANGEATRMLVGETTEMAAIYLLIEETDSADSICPLTEARPTVKTAGNIPTMVKQFESLLSKKGTL